MFYSRISKYLLVVVLVVTFVVDTLAQQKDYVEFEATIIIDGGKGKIDGTTIDISINDKDNRHFELPQNGQFIYRLKFNNEYKLTFSKPGHFSRIILISTIVPKNILDQNSDFPLLEARVELLPEIEGMDKTFALKPYARVFYDSRIDDFAFELIQNEFQLGNQVNQAIIQDKQVEKEKKTVDKLQVQELLEMQKEYDRIIREAEGFYEKTEYPQALAKYKEARELFAERPYPNERIREIQDLLAALGLTEKQKQELNQQYKAIIGRADEKFKDQAYAEALAIYKQALQIKAGDSYALKKVDDINTILAQRDKEARFAETLARAEAFFNRKEYQQAREQYRQALEILPGDSRPVARILEIENALKLAAEQNANNENYRLAIQEGDNLFGQKRYADAIGSYKKALGFSPNDARATKGIKDSELQIELIRKQSQYDELIASADKAFRNKDYTLAETEYKKALDVKPEEKYPKDQIAQITAINASKSEDQLKRQQYTSWVNSGDSLLNIRKLEEAKTAYTKALNLMPDQAYPNRKIQQINNELKALADQEVKQKQIDANYNAAILRGDLGLKNQQYESARMAYNEALRIRPGEKYPNDKIIELDKILEEKRLVEENERLYAESIRKAEKAFNENQLDIARSDYEMALKYKPGSQLPGQRIAEINAILQQRAEVERLARQEADQRKSAEKASRERYQQAIQIADNYFNQKNYDDARASYTSAIAALPDEKYPKDRIKEIESILDELNLQKTVARQQEIRDSIANVKEQQYARLIQQADQLAVNKEYASAIAKLNEAVVILPSKRPEVNEKISKIRDQERISGKQNSDYSLIVANADKLYNSGKYEEARVLYADASNIKSNEAYPKTQIKNIQTLLKNREEDYKNMIASGDANFNSKKWQSAKNDYAEALTIKPGDEYATRQIQKINQQVTMMLASNVEETLNKKAYEDMIRQGEELLTNKKYKEARAIFEIAKSMKPSETFPDQRIKEIDQLLAKQEESTAVAVQTEDDQYRQLIAQADQAFRIKNYEDAVAQYKNALLAKPGEQYPQKQIDLIAGITGKKETTEKIVTAGVTTQTAAATNKNIPVIGTKEYTGTSPRYLENLNVSETNKLYDETIILADESFNQKDYSVARFFYYKASDIKPSEQYPRQRIEEIGRLIDVGLSADMRSSYDNAIKQGDESFTKKAYTVAKFYYNKALEIKSWERYPKDRIHEIQVLTNSLLSEREERIYNESIAQADEAYYAKNYSVARFHYNQALNIKPEERYPKIKLEDIKKLIVQEKHEDVKLNYMNQLKLADLAFEQGNYSVARFYYNKASGIQKNEQYPKDQILRIETILAKRRE